MCKTTNKSSPEVRERAVRLVMDNNGQHSSRWQAIISVFAKIGCVANAGLTSFRREGETGAVVEDRLAARHQEIAGRVEVVKARAKAVLNAAQDRSHEFLKDAEEGFEETQETD